MNKQQHNLYRSKAMLIYVFYIAVTQLWEITCVKLLNNLIFSEPSAENFRCQKCLEKGHWTYQCTGKRKYVQRDSRTKVMNKKMKSDEEQKKIEFL